ncbi:uncharacterized protein ARMOST_08223 [Armillaria ostoyae]|uniref:DUF6535 domain-containing protein n=1 Tax=Armillaria ostoyae TaxID=47428 RepID=A0A284R7Z4_ARMOS|nr:uncharacterized protein ARMOST_08223 [Armillaria ostoyae]
MPIHKSHGTSILDPGQDEAIVCRDAEAEEQGIRRGREHQHNLAEQEVELDEVAGLERQELDEVPTGAPPTFTTAANAKTFFGMRRSNPTAKKGNDSYDYEQKYPEDPIFEETAPNARVWRTYEDESRIHDVHMVEQARDSADGLLVFAGLFSAVVTTFVVQTSQSLQPNYAAMSASLLYESVLIQRAIANGSSVNTITPSPFNPNTVFVPTTTDIWWLYHYIKQSSGTPRDHAFLRQFQYSGFRKWKVQTITGLLPVILHLALVIFFIGLALSLSIVHIWQQLFFLFSFLNVHIIHLCVISFMIFYFM